jgi:internalin A
MPFKKYEQIWDESRLRGYLGAINRQCGIVETLALPTMRDLPPVKIETLFVPPILSIEAVTADSNPDEWPEGRGLLEELEDSPRLVVLGDPGGGKTTLSNWLAWRLTSGLTSPLPRTLQNILPIPCILRDMPNEFFKDGKNIIDLVEYVGRRVLGEKVIDVLPVLHDWVVEGRFILILDGVDEIPVESRSYVAGWLREAKERKASVFATSRIVGYEDFPVDSPVKDAFSKNISEKVSFKISSSSSEGSLALDSEKNPGSWAELRYLMPFNKKQISDFVRNWYRQRCTSDKEAKEKTLDLLSAFKDSEVTSKLARTPNLLSLMAVVHRERAHLPDGKALLYEEIVNAYLNTIDMQRKITQVDTLGIYTWRDKKSWLSYVGYKMQSARNAYSQRGILVSEKQVLSWLVKAMRDTGVMEPESVAAEFLSWVARRSGLLLPRGEGYYAFVHLSFQEYFCACYIESCVVAPNFFGGHSSRKSGLKSSEIQSWSKDSSWLETLIFVFEILSNERSSGWIESLIVAIFEKYPKHSVEHGLLGRLAARLATNKHVKLPAKWMEYLVSCSSVMVHSFWEEQRKNVSVDAFQSAGYFLELLGEDDGGGGGKNTLRKSDLGVLDKSKVRVLVCRSMAELEPDFLDDFTNLTVLDVSNCGEFDLSRCVARNLSLLQVVKGKVVGLESIASFKSLQRIRLLNVEQSGLELVSGSSNITDVFISHVNISSPRFLVGWKKVQQLELTGVEVSSLQFLKTFKQLSYLTLDEVPISDVGFLGHLQNLEFLSLRNCPIRNIPELKPDFPLGVSLFGLKITDLDFLTGVASLNGVVIGGCPVENLNGLKGKDLAYLYLQGVPLKNLDVLSTISGLRSLVMRDIDVEDLSPLSKLKSAVAIRLYEVPVRDLKWVRRMGRLYHLMLRGTKVSDLSPLKNLKYLSDLILCESDNIDASILEGAGLRITVMPYDDL